MSAYRIPIFYDPTHYKDQYAEGKDVGTWMINTLANVLISHGFQPLNEDKFQIVTDKQKQGDDNIFVGQITGTDPSATHTISINTNKPRELTIHFTGQAVKESSNEEIIKEYRTLLEEASFIRTKHQFEEVEEMDTEKINTTENETSKTASGESEAKNGSGTGGCYIATAVYGSYDCPEVWTLRRFRDEKLSLSMSGRLFIRAYYAISPIIVRLFGNTTWFNLFWRGRLDQMVCRLKNSGYADTPYKDR